MNEGIFDDKPSPVPPSEPPRSEGPGWPLCVERQVAVRDNGPALAALGLDEAEIHDWVRRGELRRDTSSPHYPRWHRFQLAPAETIRCMRDTLVGRGWTSCDLYSVAAVVAPAGAFALLVCTGDKNTGNPGLFGRNRYKRGEDSRAAFELRQLQLPMDLDPDEEVDGGEAFDTIPTLPEDEPLKDFWVLLRRREGRTVHLDLIKVQAGDLSGSGYIEKSRMRILLRSVDLDVALLEPVATPDAIDVPVEPHQPPGPLAGDVADEEK